MAYFKHLEKGALWACYFILVFQVSRFWLSDKNIDSILNFIADFGYNLGVIFVAGPLAVYLIEKAARDHD